MKAIAAYMASRSNENRQGENRNNYGEVRNEFGGNQGNYGEMRRGETRNEYRGAENRQRQPNQYTKRNGMDEEWPENNEMRRRRDSRGRYMMDDERWETGAQRSEYAVGAVENEPINRRMDDDEGEKPMNVIQWPYGPGTMPPENRTIGFGNRSHYDGGRQAAEVGGTMWMQPVEKDRSGVMMFDRETAEEWVQNMRNEDKNHPHGGKWTPEALKPFAQKYNIPVDSPKFWEFYAMTNAMYSDYSEVVKKFGVTSPEFYACMAKAFMDDRDAEPDKVARYYEYIAKK